MDEDLVIDDATTIPGRELSWSASRAGGPGGQHVNTTDTRIRLRYAMSTSQALSDAVKNRLAAAHPRWLTAEGDVVLNCATYRSQHRNILAARERLVTAVRAALRPPKPRRPTRPTRASRRRRIQGKRQRGDLKRSRGKIRRDD